MTPKTDPFPSGLLDRFGQAAIAVRHALAAGDAKAASAAVPDLDEAHRIEILLGAAIRDGKEDFAAVGWWLAEDMEQLCATLASPPDTRLDDRAVGLIIRRRAPEHWKADGPAPLVNTPEDVADALANGAGGLAILDQLQDRLIYAAVREYYVRGTIHALGVRPLLILAGCRRA